MLVRESYVCVCVCMSMPASALQSKSAAHGSRSIECLFVQLVSIGELTKSSFDFYLVVLNSPSSSDSVSFACSCG